MGDEVTPTTKDEDRRTTVDNLYGVDFSRLMSVIRNNSDHVAWTPDTPVTALTPTRTASSELSVEQKRPAVNSKFQVSLKNFQIHQRQKQERLGRRAILLLETQKFYEDNR